LPTVEIERWAAPLALNLSHPEKEEEKNCNEYQSRNSQGDEKSRPRKFMVGMILFLLSCHAENPPNPNGSVAHRKQVDIAPQDEDFFG
jgi:hypothetical protein